MTDLLPTPVVRGAGSPSPFGGGGTWSRRSFLGMSSALSLGALVGCSSPMSATREQLVDPARRGGAKGAGAGEAYDYSPVLPLSVTADAVLSQDFFVFKTHKIDPAKDKVIAYSRADGEVEAVLLQDGSIKQIYRDPTQPGGWNVHTIPDATGVVDMVAGASRRRAVDDKSTPSEPVLKVFYRTQDDLDRESRGLAAVLHVAVAGAGATPSFTTETVPWGAKTGRLQMTVGFDDSVVVAAMVESSSLTADDAQLFVWTDTLWGQQEAPVHGSLTGFSYTTAGIAGTLPPRWSATLVKNFTGDTQLTLALPHGTYGPYKIGSTSTTPPAVSLWGWPVKLNRPAGARMVNYVLGPGNPPVPSATTTAYSVEHSSALGSVNFAALIVRTLDSAGGTPHQRLWSAAPASENGAPSTWTWTEMVLPVPQQPSSPLEVSVGVSPLPSSEAVHDYEVAARRFMDTFVLADGTFSVVRQAPQGDADLDWRAPVYCPAIPLQTGVAAMTSQANVSTGDELLVVGDDGTLQYLVKDPVTGQWTDNPVRLPADSTEEVSTYRVTLGVVDAWALPVRQKSLQVTASSSAVALLDGAAVTLGDQAVTVTTDDAGEVVLALVAEGLAAPSLTVSGSDVPATTINPSAAVNQYMQGDGPLNFLPPLTAQTLAEATTPDGERVAPEAAGDAGAAEDAVGNMRDAARQAAGQVGASTLGGRRRVEVRHQRDGHLRSKAQAASVLSDIDHWRHDALHAIKKGAVKVARVVWDVDEKAFHIFGEFLNWKDNPLHLVIKTMEDAGHVFLSTLSKLGGDVEKGVKWVRVEVVSVMQDAADLADTYVGWVGQCCDYVSRFAGVESAKVDAWLTRTKDAITADLTTIANGYPVSTTLATMATDPPKGVSAAPPRSGRHGGAAFSDVGKTGDWFYDKIKKELLGELELTGMPDLQGLVRKALTVLDAALVDAFKAFEGYLKFWARVVTRPDKVLTAGVRELLLETVKLIDAVFELARGISDTLLGLLGELAKALPGILAQVSKKSPLAISLVGLMKRDHTTVTVGHHAAMSFAYRAVLDHRLTHQGKGRPFAPAVAGRKEVGDDDLDDELTACAAAALMTWAAIDAKSQVCTALKVPTGVATTAVDIMAPFLVGALTVPSTQGGEPYFTPPVTSSDADLENFVSWLFSIAPGAWTLMGLYCERTGEKDPDLPAQKRMVLFATFASGVISLALGCAANKASAEPSGSDYAAAVLLNMPYIIVPALDDALVESTEGVSAGIAAAVTAATGFSGAEVYAHGS